MSVNDKEVFILKEGRITLWDGLITGGTKLSKEALIESFGERTYKEIQQFGFYAIKK